MSATMDDAMQPPKIPRTQTLREMVEERLALKAEQRRLENVALEAAAEEENTQGLTTDDATIPTPAKLVPHEVPVRSEHQASEIPRRRNTEAAARETDDALLLTTHAPKELQKNQHLPPISQPSRSQSNLKRTAAESLSVPNQEVIPRKNPPPNFAGLKSAKKRKRTDDANSPSTDPIGGPIALHESSPSSVNAPKKASRSKIKATYSSYEIIDLSKRLPEWYQDLKTVKQRLARGDLELLRGVKDNIQRCIENKSKVTLRQCFSELRVRISDMQFYVFLTPGASGGAGLAPYLIKESKILEDGGLPVIFNRSDSGFFPFDIRADAEAIWTRWMRGDFDPSLLRGVDPAHGVLQKSGRKRTAYKLTPGYQHKISANVFGANGLFNGQWWPSRLCALRDGAHGEVEAGICGSADSGAFAVVVSQGGYADQDNGDTLEYCGTEGKNGVVSKGTQFLQHTHRKGEVLRVLRAPKKNSVYAPKSGVRYDGLYRIVDSKTLDPINVMIRFTLIRVEGQDPIRCSGETSRPTSKEEYEMSKIRSYLQ